MSFLAPLYLLLGGAIAVPLLIHLLRRRTGMRVEFPAARYLERAEKENSRTLKIRNLLLMMLRVLALLLIALAAARPVARWVGAGHAPTAIAIVIDNSLSSSAVVNGRSVLDGFKAMARDVLSRDVRRSACGSSTWMRECAADHRRRCATRSIVSKRFRARAIPKAALARAAVVVRSAGLDARQIALVTDGQRTEWQDPGSIPDAQVLLYATPGAPPTNRAVTLAEARPVRWTPRGAVATRFLSKDSTTFRMTLGGRTFARGTAAPNEEVVVRAAPPERGWVAGTVELEPDELAGDNVRHFAVWIGPAPGVNVSPTAGQFVKEAVDVLRTSGPHRSGAGHCRRRRRRALEAARSDHRADRPRSTWRRESRAREGGNSVALRCAPRRRVDRARNGVRRRDYKCSLRSRRAARRGCRDVGGRRTRRVGRRGSAVRDRRFAARARRDESRRCAPTFVPWLGGRHPDGAARGRARADDRRQPRARILVRAGPTRSGELGDGRRAPLSVNFSSVPSRAGTYFLSARRPTRPARGRRERTGR